MTDERSRTFSWEDPMIGASAAMTMSGLEYMQAIERGEIPVPPIAKLMNMGGVEVSAGRVVFSVVPEEYHYNPIGMVHGGLAATILDSALGCTIQTMLPAGVGYSTLELKVNYVRAMTIKTGRVRAIGEMIHMGRTTAIAEAKLLDDQDKLYAFATTTCMIMRPE
jgi:uncharacterized protein (TIGR00369 family)